MHFHLRLIVLFTQLIFLSMCASGETIVVSMSGNDRNAGDNANPLRTISAAAKKAMPGDTVLVLQGVYRERVTPMRGGTPSKRITYKAQPGKRVFIKGSEIWEPEWQNHGNGIFSGVPDDELFTDRSPEYVDGYNPFKIKLSSTPWERDGKQEVDRGFGGDPNLFFTCGQVFVNGRPFREVPFKEEIKQGHWFYDSIEDRIHIGFGDKKPTDQKVEITTRRRIFAPQERGLGYITVQGFVMEHCGNQYPTNFWREIKWAQKGALGLEAGHHWIIRRNVVRYAKTFAIDAGYVDNQSHPNMPINDNIIEENYIVDNGSAGILSNRSENMIIRGNVILNNNTSRFFELKRWEQAGIKCHHMTNGHIHHNYIADNQLTYGVWLDNQFADSRVSHNVIVNNDRAGIFLEMSDYGFDRLLVDNNVLVGNRENAVYIHDASGATFVHNLFANTPSGRRGGQAVLIKQATARTKSGHHKFFGNLFIDNHRLVDINHPSYRGGPQQVNENLYDGEATEQKFAINKMSDKPSPWEDDEFVGKIISELGDASSGDERIEDSKRVLLSSVKWQAFWRKHGFENDTASQFHSGGQAQLDRENQILTVRITSAPLATSAGNTLGLDADFFGVELKRNGNDLVGPFQNLKSGDNEFSIWSGLPILVPNELPTTSFNQL